LYVPRPAYPSKEHEEAAQAVLAYFRDRPHVKAVLLTNSCARGKATRDSCLDLLVVHTADAPQDALRELRTGWSQYHAQEAVFRALEKVGRFSEVDLEFGDAVVDAASFHRGPGSGPDHLELELGNLYVYSVVMWESELFFQRLREPWLPYYSDHMRRDRLAGVLRWFRNNLDHIHPFAQRGFHLACIKRIHHATEEFLQALFISRKVYPIAYDKHVHEQIVDIIDEPDLYPRLLSLFEMETLDARSLSRRVEMLERLMSEYVSPP
jgi:predicted nucleotidyltransferase